MSPSILRRAVAALALAAGVAGCRPSREPVRIGLVFPGDFSPVTSLVSDAVNAAGGVRGRMLAVVRDTLPGADWVLAETDIRRARSVVYLGVTAVVGHAGSRASLAAAQVYSESRVVQVVPTGTSRLLAGAGGWTFPLPPNDSVEGHFIASFVRERLRARTVVVFYVNDEYGIGLRDGVRAAFAGTGVRVLREVRYDLRADLAALVDAAVRGRVPDAVVVAGRGGETGAIARRLNEQGVPCRVVAGDGSYVLPELVTTAGPGAEGIYVVAFWLPGAADSATRRLEARVRERLGREPVATDALIFDAVRLLAAAVEAVGDRPQRIRRYLLELGVSRPRFRGVTGEIGFGPGAGPPRLVMGVVRGGAVVPADAVTR